MSQKRTTKTLHYFRAVRDGNPYPLQKKLLATHDPASSLASREIILMGSDVIRLQRLKNSEGSTFIHLSRHMPGESALTLEANTHKAEDEEKELHAPEGRAYVNGHCYMLINGHNLVFCSHGISLSRAQHYLYRFMEQRGLPKQEATFDISAAARIEKLQLIRRHGVRHINLDAHAYKLAMPDSQPNTFARKAMNKVWNEIRPLWERDDAEADQKAMENLLVGVQLTLDGNTRAGLHSKAAIENVAIGLAEDADDQLHDFKIVTQRGETINMSEIKLTTHKSILREAQALDRDDCWNKLAAYHGDLKQKGLLEQ